MFGRKNYTPEELDHATEAIGQQLAAYKKLAQAVEATSDPAARSALEAFEPLFCNKHDAGSGSLLRSSPADGHRQRRQSAHEVELVADSVMNNGAILRGNNVIKFAPEESVLKLTVGDKIKLTAAQFERLAKAFLAEIQSKFL